jgi:acyl-CoA synthetase (AMP-forming)/AMP-acid ligase II
VPHEKWGETPKAVVVLEPGAKLDPEELIALTRERVGAVQKVTSVDVVDELPRSAIGKLLRREVRERYWAGRAERVAGA